MARPIQTILDEMKPKKKKLTNFEQDEADNEALKSGPANPNFVARHRVNEDRRKAENYSGALKLEPKKPISIFGPGGMGPPPGKPANKPMVKRSVHPSKRAELGAMISKVGGTKQGFRAPGLGFVPTEDEPDDMSFSEVKSPRLASIPPPKTGLDGGQAFADVGRDMSNNRSPLGFPMGITGRQLAGATVGGLGMGGLGAIAGMASVPTAASTQALGGGALAGIGQGIASGGSDGDLTDTLANGAMGAGLGMIPGVVGQGRNLMRGAVSPRVPQLAPQQSAVGGAPAPQPSPAAGPSQLEMQLQESIRRLQAGESLPLRSASSPLTQPGTMMPQNTQVGSMLPPAPKLQAPSAPQGAPGEWMKALAGPQATGNIRPPAMSSGMSGTLPGGAPTALDGQIPNQMRAIQQLGPPPSQSMQRWANAPTQPFVNAGTMPDFSTQLQPRPMGAMSQPGTAGMRPPPNLTVYNGGMAPTQTFAAPSVTNPSVGSPMGNASTQALAPGLLDRLAGLLPAARAGDLQAQAIIAAILGAGMGGGAALGVGLGAPGAPALQSQPTQEPVAPYAVPRPYATQR